MEIARIPSSEGILFKSELIALRLQMLSRSSLATVASQLAANSSLKLLLTTRGTTYGLGDSVGHRDGYGKEGSRTEDRTPIENRKNLLLRACHLLVAVEKLHGPAASRPA
jgi:hypothetical protein